MDEKWHHVLVTVAEGDVRFYLDGQLKGTKFVTFLFKINYQLLSSFVFFFNSKILFHFLKIWIIGMGFYILILYYNFVKLCNSQLYSSLKLRYEFIVLMYMNFPAI